MNVLIFVMTMLMLLALMTYARLETYRNSQVFQILFENFMQKDERGYINMVAEKKYETTKGSTRESGKGSTKKVAASPRVSLNLLFKKTEKEGAPQAVEHFKALLKNLMTTLYEEQPFYQQIYEKRPSFIDDIVAALIRTVENLPENQKLKKTTDLANLTLGDDQLDDTFYKMLHGAPYKEVFERVEAPPEEKAEEVQSDEDPSDSSIIEKEAEEHQSPKGYYSLLDFITLQPLDRVRVYLAPKEVLKAVYRNDAIVNDIIRKRGELYHQAQLTDSDGIKSLSESFKNEFQNRQDPTVGDDVLDYTVTKTNPTKYETIEK